MQETLLNEMDELAIAIKDLEYYISTLHHSADFMELAINRNQLHSYRCAYETYRGALLRYESEGSCSK